MNLKRIFLSIALLGFLQTGHASYTAEEKAEILKRLNEMGVRQMSKADQAVAIQKIQQEVLAQREAKKAEQEAQAKAELEATLANSLMLSNLMGYSPQPYQWAAVSHVEVKEVKDPKLNLDALNIKPLQTDFNWMLFYSDPKNQMGLPENVRSYMLSSGVYQVEDPKNPGKALNLSASGMVPTRAIHLAEGPIVIYYGVINGTPVEGYENGMDDPAFATAIASKEVLQSFDKQKAMQIIKAHEDAKKENYERVRNAKQALVKLPEKGKLSTPELEALGKDIAQSVTRQDNATYGHSVVMSNNWTITRHALTGVPKYRTATVAFTQEYKGKCKLQGFRILQDYDGSTFSGTPRFSSIVFDYPFNQNMSCDNL